MSTALTVGKIHARIGLKNSTHSFIHYLIHSFTNSFIRSFFLLPSNFKCLTEVVKLSNSFRHADGRHFRLDRQFCFCSVACRLNKHLQAPIWSYANSSDCSHTFLWCHKCAAKFFSPHMRPVRMTLSCLLELANSTNCYQQEFSLSYFRSVFSLLHLMALFLSYQDYKAWNISMILNCNVVWYGNVILFSFIEFFICVQTQ